MCLVLQAHIWASALPDHEIIKRREGMILAIEEADKKMERTGMRAAWFHSCDAVIAKLCSGVNGPLLTELANAIKVNTECIDTLRYGNEHLCCACMSFVFLIRGSLLGHRKRGVIIGS